MRSLALLTALLAAACSAAPVPSPTPEPDDGFVLRMWTTQALPPKDTFGMGSQLTIADGILYTPGAMPAIYPGPLLTPYGGRTIDANGISRILAEAQRWGMLGPITDFTGELAPGGVTGHLLMGPADEPRHLIGDPSAVMMCITTPCDPPPASPNAFAAFWTWLQSAPYDALAQDLGDETLAPPERLSLIIGAPFEDAAMPGGQMDWPLSGTFAETGVPFAGDAGSRCLTLEGEDLATALPSLQAANQLTRFVDTAGFERGVIARVLLPLDEDPCAA